MWPPGTSTFPRHVWTFLCFSCWATSSPTKMLGWRNTHWELASVSLQLYFCISCYVHYFSAFRDRRSKKGPLLLEYERFLRAARTEASLWFAADTDRPSSVNGSDAGAARRNTLPLARRLSHTGTMFMFAARSVPHALDKNRHGMRTRGNRLFRQLFVSQQCPGSYRRARYRSRCLRPQNTRLPDRTATPKTRKPRFPGGGAAPRRQRQTTVDFPFFQLLPPLRL